MDNIINDRRFTEIAEKIDKLNSADDYSLSFSIKKTALTRFADNMVTQNIDKFNEKLFLTSYFNGKKGTLSSSDLSDDGIKNLVDKCETAAKNSVVDLEYIPTLSHIEQKITNNIDEKILRITPKDRAEIAKYAIEHAKKENATAFGTVSDYLNGWGISTKNGMRKYYAHTNFSYKNTIDFNGEKGAAWKSSVRKDDVNHVEHFEEALLDAINMQNRIEFEPGRYKVLLSARAAKDLYMMMSFYGMSRRAVDEGYSPYSGKLGEKIGDERISIFTDPNDPSVLSSPFDSEGMPIDKSYIIKEGILDNVPCSRFWAKKNDLNPWSIGNIIIPGSERGENELLKKIERGFYIKEFWYIRLVNMEDLTLTGMTRNGFFYVEDGKIKSGSNHFRWNDSPYKMLNRIVELGISEGNTTEWGFGTSIPSMIVDDFYLSSKTLF